MELVALRADEEGIHGSFVECISKLDPKFLQVVDNPLETGCNGKVK
jgi:hypothetical protein